jgi:hypothetical protein
MYDPIEPYRFEKRHEFTIQECTVLDVREVVCFFRADQYHKLDYLHLACRILLEARKCGAARRWYFMCPACSRLCEHLYVPPGKPVLPGETIEAPPRADWRCRECWNLNYGSQHYGRTHALRRQLPPRRGLSHRRRTQRANRIRQKRFHGVESLS